MVWCGIHLRVMPEFVSYQVIWEYVNTCTYVVPVFWSHGFIQMRFGLFSFSCFYFMSNRYYPNFWMLLNLRYQKTSFLCKHNFLLMRTRAMKLDTKAKVFHESISCFMKCPWNCISWNALKEIFHSVSLPLNYFHFIYSKIKSHFWVYFKFTTKYFLVERSGVPLHIYIYIYIEETKSHLLVRQCEHMIERDATALRKHKSWIYLFIVKYNKGDGKILPLFLNCTKAFITNICIFIKRKFEAIFVNEIETKLVW